MTKPISSQPNVCKPIFLLSICIFFITNIFAQVGISTTSITPDATSILELRSTTLGFLAPRMTTAQRDAITTPATGLLIYNTTTNQLNYYSGAAWQVVAGGGQSQLNGTGFVKASGTTISYDNSTYLTSYSETDPTVKAINGVVKSNGTTISAATVGTDYSGGTSALSTGILKSTTGTGALTIAVPSDFPILNQNTTGNATTVTTNANLTGDVTSVGNATTLATVNSNVGTWNNITVNGKGLVTAGSNASYATTSNNLSAFASTTSAQLAGVLSDETGTGSAVFSASPTFTGTPTLPTGTIATTQTAGNNTTAIATTAFVTATNNNASYRTILEAAGSHTAAKVAGTYAMGYGDPIAVSGTGTLYPLATIYIAAADYPTVNGITTKLRIRAQLYTNDVAPTGNFTFGLYPVTRPATSGAAGLDIYTLGTVVTGSNGATFTTPAADGLLQAVGSDFALPADGFYVIGIITSATVAGNSHLHMNAQLQMRNN